MIDRIINWSWRIFPWFIIILVAILSLKLMILITPYSYPFELIAWGLVATPGIFIIILIKTMLVELKA